MFALSKTYPYMLKVRVPYSEAAVAFLHTLPGASWDQTKKLWYVPKEWAPKLSAFFGEECEVSGDAADVANLSLASDRPYQRDAAKYLIRHSSKGNGAILSMQMRMGKTVVALDAVWASRSRFQNIMVVCPAMARPVWLQHAAKWLPEALVLNFNESAASSKKASAARDDFFSEWKAYLPGAQHLLITSYGLLGKLDANVQAATDLVIFDELHELANAQTARWEAANDLIMHYAPRAFRVGLTGTLQRNEPASLYGALSIIYPKRFGIFYGGKNPETRSFAGRYANVSFNGYGHDFDGLNPAHADELRQRLEACAHVKLRSDPDAASYFLGGTFAVKDTPALTLAPDGREKWLQELAGTAIANGESVAFMVWERSEAEFVYESIADEAEGNAVLLTGADNSERRMGKLNKLSPDKPAALVATIASTQTAIDLSRFTDVHYLQLAEQSAMMEQSVDRFALGNGNVTFWASKETLPGMRRLERKLSARAAVLRSGKSAEDMRLAFSKQQSFTEEEWNAAIQDALSFSLAES